MHVLFISHSFLLIPYSLLIHFLALFYSCPSFLLISCSRLMNFAAISHSFSSFHFQSSSKNVIYKWVVNKDLGLLMCWYNQEVVGKWKEMNWSEWKRKSNALAWNALKWKRNEMKQMNMKEMKAKAASQHQYIIHIIIIQSIINLNWRPLTTSIEKVQFLPPNCLGWAVIY